jgi:hypothetical protein
MTSTVLIVSLYVIFSIELWCLAALLCMGHSAFLLPLLEVWEGNQ